MPLLSSPKTILIFLCIATTLFPSSTTIAQDSSPNKNFKFLFSAVVQVIQNGQPKIIPLTDNMLLKSGNLIKFYFEFERDGWLYFFYEDSAGDLSLLYPKELEQSKILKFTPVFVPEGFFWIELDSKTGKETFHLIVSSVQLEQLESLYGARIVLKERSDIKQSTQSILAEIKSLGRKSLIRPAEKPLRIAGKLRGNSGSDQPIPIELFSTALEVTASRTYVKSITIDHK